MTTKFSLNNEDVAVVVGTGAGGATVAAELAMQGLPVVMLEAGAPLEFADVVNDEVAMAAKIGWMDHRIAGTGPNQPMPNMAKTVGGTTLFWGGVAVRFLEHDFQTRSVYGAMDGANLLDWPLSLNDLLPFYEQAEKRMGVTGSKTSGLALLPENNHYKVIAEGARRIGYKKIIRPLAINSEVYQGRPSCMQIGFCFSGCKIGAKWSTLYTEMPTALATGKAELRTEAMVLKVEHDDQRRVTGVLYADVKGNRYFQKARVVCIAGNAVESPRLLLNSRSASFPQGLANSSGQVGRNFMTHAAANSFAVHEEAVHMYRGTTMAAIVADEAAPNTKRGFVGGYLLEGLSLGLPFTSAAILPDLWGRAVTNVLDRYDHMSSIWVCGEDLPQESNSVLLHGSLKDSNGLPIPIITKLDHPNDNVLRDHACLQAKRLVETVGATQVFQSVPALNGHNLGTLRMSRRPSEGVVNEWGQTHDITNLFISDGSQFTSSSSANPTLTIVALAIRQASYISRSVASRAL